MAVDAHELHAGEVRQLEIGFARLRGALRSRHTRECRPQRACGANFPRAAGKRPDHCHPVFHQEFLVKGSKSCRTGVRSTAYPRTGTLTQPACICDGRKPTVPHSISFAQLASSLLRDPVTSLSQSSPNAGIFFQLMKRKTPEQSLSFIALTFVRVKHLGWRL